MKAEISVSSEIGRRGLRRMRANMRRVRVWYAMRFGRTPVVKVYGLLRTGTNYIARLIDLNFDTFCLGSVEEGWKHGPCAYDAGIKYVFMVKDPYSWLVSFMEWERIHGRFSGQTVTEFLAGPVTHPELKNAWHCGDVVSAWNQSLAAWRANETEENVVFIRYEDVLESFENVLCRIGGVLGLRQRQQKLMDLAVRADDWETPKPRKQLSKEYYREARYLEQFTEADLQTMRERLDHGLVKAYGYKVL